MKYDIQVSENPVQISGDAGGAVAAESGYKGEEAWNRARLQAPLGRAPDSRRRGRRARLACAMAPGHLCAMTRRVPLTTMVRRNLDQAKTILDALIKREEKKRELVESEVTLQRIQMKYKHETELLEDSLALPGLPSFPSKVGSSEEEFFDSDDVANSRPNSRLVVVQNPPFTESKLVMVPAGNARREARRRVPHSWLHKLDPTEPAMLFTKPLLPDKLAAAGIVPPSDPSTPNSTSARSLNFHGRIGRGGRIVFDRWNPLMHTPVDGGDTLYVPPKPRHLAHN
ncbi:UNVERIFIED_CONTAM: hypothetical protein Sradi_2610300 [Sesamum radiatum]|uniref:Uncharacterized protein n=1 Tax=Sesamum radiatum TaxID=300843 RepID=A0AAW2S5B7_SESRA